MNDTFLQTFLLVNVFVIGVLVSVAARHAYAHFRPLPEEKKVQTPTHPQPLTPTMKEALIHEAQATFKKELDYSINDLHRNLTYTSVQINKHLQKLGVTIVQDEMQRFKTLLDQLRKQTESTVLGGQAELSHHQTQLQAKLDARHTELETKLADDIASEKRLLIQQIDTKLSDAVASFLTETLQHNVDLGAQSDYLIAMLEEHKTDFTKGFSDDI